MAILNMVRRGSGVHGPRGSVIVRHKAYAESDLESVIRVLGSAVCDGMECTHNLH